MSSYHVLVVDDNHEIRRMVTASIKTLSADIDVLEVPSAEEALFISASLPLDLIVLDFRLPGMSGLEMVEKLRKRKPGIKIILVTGIEDPAARQHVAEAGVYAYFFKPIEIGAFLTTVRNALWPEPVVEPGISITPAVTVVPGTSPIPNSSEAAHNNKAPDRSAIPGISRTPGSSVQPASSVAPAETKILDISKPLADSAKNAPVEPVSKEKILTPVVRFQPTLDERLNALKQQLKASLVLLLAESGQIVEMAGNPSPVTYNPVFLPALVETFKASQKVSDAFGGDTTESLLSYMCGRQRIYLAPVNSNNALLVATQGYFEPDKLGLIDRAIHLAAQDLQTILEHQREREAEKARLAEAAAQHAELSANVVVDQETLDLIENMFSKAPKKGGKEKADGFWETLEENGALDGQRGKDVISYDQAREMGLAPGQDDQP